MNIPIWSRSRMEQPENEPEYPHTGKTADYSKSKIHYLLLGHRFTVTTSECAAYLDVTLRYASATKRFFSYSGGLTVPESTSIERHLLERSLEALVLQFVTDVAQLKRSGYLEGTELVLKTGGE